MKILIFNKDNIISMMLFFTILALVYFIICDVSFAATAAKGEGLPWEGALDKIVKSLTGPVAYGVSLIGVVACGAGLIFGNELSQFMKSIIFVVMVICLLVFAQNILTTVMGATVPEIMAS